MKKYKIALSNILILTNTVLLLFELYDLLTFFYFRQDYGIVRSPSPFMHYFFIITAFIFIIILLVNKKRKLRINIIIIVSFLSFCLLIFLIGIEPAIKISIPMHDFNIVIYLNL
ncbi:MAG: hypothetical protein AB1765_11110 [Candidatus Hydrogenedentota bacterium]